MVIKNKKVVIMFLSELYDYTNTCLCVYRYSPNIDQASEQEEGGDPPPRERASELSLARS